MTTVMVLEIYRKVQSSVLIQGSSPNWDICTDTPGLCLLVSTVLRF